MKKKYKLILVSILAITAILVSTIAISTNANRKNISEEDILNIANKVNGKSKLLNDDTVIAIVNGQEVYKGELEYRKVLYDANNQSQGVDDYKTPFEKICLEKYEKYYAEKNDLKVTEEEIAKEISHEKEQSIEIKNDDFLNKYIENLGLTQEQYWNEYRPIEIERYFTHLKVINHIYENNLEKVGLVKEKVNVQENEGYAIDKIEEYLRNQIDIEYIDEKLEKMMK